MHDQLREEHYQTTRTYDFATIAQERQLLKILDQEHTALKLKYAELQLQQSHSQGQVDLQVNSHHNDWKTNPAMINSPQQQHQHHATIDNLQEVLSTVQTAHTDLHERHDSLQTRYDKLQAEHKSLQATNTSLLHVSATAVLDPEKDRFKTLQLQYAPRILSFPSNFSMKNSLKPCTSTGIYHQLFQNSFTVLAQD